MSDDLLARLEAAGGPDRELDWQIEKLVFPRAHMLEGPLPQDPRYTGSIDAALTLATGDAVERVGGAVGILRWAIDLMREAGAGIDQLPRFICIAALRARRGV